MKIYSLEMQTTFNIYFCNESILVGIMQSTFLFHHGYHFFFEDNNINYLYLTHLMASTFKTFKK